MFSRKDQLIKKTGEDGVGRYEFLKQLVNEFTTTRSYESKRQTLANLANFAYDPINFEFIKQLHILDLFLAQLSEDSAELIHFALAGICNLASDPENKDYIISLNGIYLVSQQLKHKDEEIKLNALTTLYYTLENQPHLITPEIFAQAELFAENSNQRLKNLGTLFLEKYRSNNVSSVGDKVSIIRKITKEDVEIFTKISGDTNPIHLGLDGEKSVVHGALLNSLVSGVIGTRLPGHRTLVLEQTLNFPNKCFVDDEVKISVELVEDRKIKRLNFICEVEKDNKTVLFGNAKVIIK